MEDTEERIKIWSGLDSSLVTSGWFLLNPSWHLLSHALHFSISSLLLQYDSIWNENEVEKQEQIFCDYTAADELYIQLWELGLQRKACPSY